MKLLPELQRQCSKLIGRHEAECRLKVRLSKDFKRSTGVAGIQKKPVLPQHWRALPEFNPYHVRALAELISHGIGTSVQNRTYRPRPALVFPITKPDGGVRQISISPVADAAVGTVVYSRILKRNQHRLSPYSYAFRRDINVHEAIERMIREWRIRHRYWVVEFDFSKYFDTLCHDYLQRTLKDHFQLTKSEFHVANSYLNSHRAFGLNDYLNGNFKEYHRGIPQGNSLSLFLANAACHELDQVLERLPITFSRYADDIVALCPTLVAAEDATEAILDHCERAGLSVNFKKSDGISIFSPEALKSNSTSKPAVDFLGYRLTFREVAKKNNPAKEVVRRVSLRDSNVKKVKGTLAKIIYRHLIKYPLAGQISKTRIQGLDWDLVRCINELRNYIYGGIKEKVLQDVLNDRNLSMAKADGALSFYPLMDDIELLKQLDGWLLSALARALEKRNDILTRLGLRPHKLTRKELLEANWYNVSEIGFNASGEEIWNDVTIPSFVRFWKYTKRSMNVFRLEKFPHSPGQKASG
jgi:hypothetical protein